MELVHRLHPSLRRDAPFSWRGGMVRSSRQRTHLYDKELVSILYKIMRLKETMINYRYGYEYHHITPMALQNLRHRIHLLSRVVQQLHRRMLDNRLHQSTFNDPEMLGYHTYQHVKYESPVMKDINHQMREVYILLGELQSELLAPSVPGRRHRMRHIVRM